MYAADSLSVGLDSTTNRGELHADMYTSYYGPTEGVSGDDLAQDVEPAADLGI